ncbi:3D-(3,5/4)-trihydroxycyclohexane-1,2-dione acylhydrolase (decyclizing) [Palleronia sp. LCG004]|uniref:3D-(3,5/4)-trihydroxycyclohexane-1,2-dione acylhydrolase (decyclizing) n=1 Tax=Palleronia sp. LCG004 TaxID=3079304 RepID=UPI002942E5A3|nr:3D-(3,5/4)-trihydroxycyclohexane-1,2-dione acylhydrolase (decyclizing) [Palleronia sp. LCG004]WOI55878.1 3D-(3,5/4)-trihydroxycyclohexane-1,2-dione acylhydrolase (decyclizing) [Palleronia sp. LCG004]
MKTVRLTAAQAMVRHVAAQKNADGDPFIEGVWAIFGHGNVAALGEALHTHRDRIRTYRGQNEQGMCHAAIAYAKELGRKRAMAVTASIGPGSTNMVTAAALAHVNRLPVLLIPSDVFAGRQPDPVLQQIEPFHDGTITANDAFRPVSAYFDRITRPEQLLTALPRAFATMTDPASCGPATISICQDVQAEAWDFPESFFEERVWTARRPRPDEDDVARLAEALRDAKRPLIVAGGGVHYSDACEALRTFAETHGIPVSETQSGKGAMPWDHPMALGGIGVSGSDASNRYAAEADLVIGIGTRFQDFTTGSWRLFQNPDLRFAQVNVVPFDAYKRRALPVIGDARAGIEALGAALGDHHAGADVSAIREDWFAEVASVTDAPGDDNELPSDQQVIGAVQRAATLDSVVMCAAGTMPGELQKLWKPWKPGSYHMEYGYSCMGYELAGAMGMKMARPDKDVICMVGDGSYMMLNSEIATAAMMGLGFTVVLTDNRGYGCINRLQQGSGSPEFNNLYEHVEREEMPQIDFVAHARAMGADAVKVTSIAELKDEIARARGKTRPQVIVIDTTPYPPKDIGGAFWDVVPPEVSELETARTARRRYDDMIKDRFKA